MENNIEQNIQFSLEFHYEFYDDSIHVMDARSFNFCELQLLKAIEELQKYVGEAKIEVGIEKRAEGSLIETIIVTLENFSESKAFIAVLTAFLTYFFTKKRSKLDDANKRLEILDKIKKASLTQEEALALIGNDSILKKLISSYYNKLAEQNEVKSVSVKGKHGNVQFAKASIESVYFKSHIVEEKETKQVYMGTTLGVCSPILISGHGKKWKGIFNGKVIEFVVEDKSFLQQVYHNDFKFGSTTTLKCDLVEKTKVLNGNSYEIIGEPTYAVIKVDEVNDNEHFQRFTKRYRKQKSDARQLDLFDDKLS